MLKEKIHKRCSGNGFCPACLYIFLASLINSLWRPIFIIVLFVIVLWREFNRVKIPQSEANKSANRWGNLLATGGVVPPSVLHLPSSCAHQIYFLTRLCCLLPCLNKPELTDLLVNIGPQFNRFAEIAIQIKKQYKVHYCKHRLQLFCFYPLFCTINLLKLS